MSGDMDAQVHQAFTELREGLGRLVERAADYSATDNLEKRVKEVATPLVKISQYVEKAKTPKSHSSEVRSDIEQLQAELLVQTQLFALCKDALSSR